MMRKYFATICQIWFGVFVKDGEAFVISILRNLVEWVRSKGNLVEWPRFKGDFSRKTLSLPAVFAVDPTPTPTAIPNIADALGENDFEYKLLATARNCCCCSSI